MAFLEIYSKSSCGFCRMAKHLLDIKGIHYREYDVTNDETLAQEMRQRSGRLTVPQIFLNDGHVGGFEDLRAAMRDGSLLQGLKESA